MAKKNKKKDRETTIENYYDLKTDKIDELVAALKGEDDEEKNSSIDYSINFNTGVYDPKNVTRRGKEKQFDPYKTDFLGKIPAWVKALFVKWWFAGAVCYFIVWGINLGAPIDSIVLTGAVLGIVVDVLVNPLFRYMETDRKEYNAYMMFPFPFKQFWTFFTNIIYYVIVLVVMYYSFYFFVNDVIFNGGQMLTVEPLLFGVFCVIIDMVFIGIKDGIVALVRHGRNSKKENSSNV